MLYVLNASCDSKNQKFKVNKFMREIKEHVNTFEEYFFNNSKPSASHVYQAMANIKKFVETLKFL